MIPTTPITSTTRSAGNKVESQGDLNQSSGMVTREQLALVANRHGRFLEIADLFISDHVYVFLARLECLILRSKDFIARILCAHGSTCSTVSRAEDFVFRICDCGIVTLSR